MESPWIAAITVLALFLALLLMLAGRSVRQRRGLGGGQTVSLDRVPLTSRRYGLTGRPDRLIRLGNQVVPEEWKSARTLQPWHKVQLGVYFLLIEDALGTVPPYGYLVAGDGTRYRIENDDALRGQVLDLAGKIRAARRMVKQPIPVRPVPWQCRTCGVREHCGQARI
jgi:CRISPR-associated exonuclease Cas4